MNFENLQSLITKLVQPGALSKIRMRLRGMRVRRSIVGSSRPRSWIWQLFASQRVLLGCGDSVLVVGASGGIGRQVYSQLLARGCDVYGTYRNSEVVSRENEQCNRIHHLDLNSAESIWKFSNWVYDLDIRLDAVVICTGILPSGDYHVSLSRAEVIQKDLLEEAGEFSRVLTVNTVGPCLLTRMLAPVLRCSPEARTIPQICILSSSIGTTSLDLYGGLYAYRASKAALHAIMMAIFYDLNMIERVGVVLLGPGDVLTEMNPNGRVSAEYAGRTIISNIERCRRYALCQFLGLGGRRIPW